MYTVKIVEGKLFVHEFLQADTGPVESKGKKSLGKKRMGIDDSNIDN